MQIQFQYANTYVFLVLAVAAILTWWLYRNFKKKHEANWWLVVSMAFLRFVSISLIGLLLMVPFVRLLKSYLEKPILAIGLDNSNSLNLLDTAAITEIEKGVVLLNENLGDDFTIETFVFGDDVKTADWDFSDKKTNLNDWLKFVNAKYKYANLGGVVTVTDGIFNEGGNPVYSGYHLNAPLYNVAVGDTISPIDARIAYVENNDISYKGNQFPIKVGLAVDNLKGEKLKLNLIKSGKILESIDVDVKGINFFSEYTFLALADEIGIQKYTLQLQDADNEISLANNIQQVFVEVLDADKNILIAYDAPHPDIAALRKSIERNRNYAIDLWWVNDPEKKNEITQLDKYHLIILHNLPKSNSPKLGRIFSANASMLLVFDNTVNFQSLNQLQNSFRVNVKSNAPNQVSSLYNNKFVAYSLNATQMNSLGDYPPLIAAFADVSFSNQSDVLLYQKIGSVATSYPLLAISQNEQKKMGVLSATGIWKWFLYEYSREEENKGLDELFNQTVQYLSVKEDKRRLRLNRTKFLFDENEEVVFTVSFYDQNYQPTQNATIGMKVKDTDGKEFEYGFLAKNGLYEMSAGQFSPGEYTYTINAALGDDVHQLKGAFTVAEVNIEYMQPVANHNLLFQLAQQHNGNLFYPKQFSKIIDAIKANETAVPIRHEKAQITELIHNKWFFYILLALLSIEWIIRKYKGSY